MLYVLLHMAKFLPEELLKIPKLGCINVHGSLLPKYRGAAPIQWAVINGDKKRQESQQCIWMLEWTQEI